MGNVVWRPIGDLNEFLGNPRRHPESQIAGLMKSIRRFWTNPILVDETGTILAGHGRWEAAKRLGMTKVPTVTVSGLSDSEKQAVVIADNRLPERAVWDFDLLRGHFQDLIKVDFDVELTGFSTGEIDLLIEGSQSPVAADPADDLAGLVPEVPAISKRGDVWELGRHRLACGDAQRRETYERLLRGERAEMLLTDPPYNVRIDGHAMGRGKVRHREFAMASGEMSPAAFRAFLTRFIRCAISSSRDGAIHYIFMDWRHLYELLGAALPLYSEWQKH
jgi:ParB-like chromosome segregation protein Spo0J